MSGKRKFLKSAAIGLLDALGNVHPLGHQPSKAGRYILTSAEGAKIEVMFEKDETSPPNFWCLERAAGTALIAELSPARSPSIKLRTKKNKHGKIQYGRHSALEKMDQLGNADLVCFAFANAQELGKIIDRLMAVTKSEVL